jgi:hypothetical protein
LPNRWSLIHSGSSRYFGRILDKIRLHSPDQAEEAVELQAIKVLPAE